MALRRDSINWTSAFAISASWATSATEGSSGTDGWNLTALNFVSSDWKAAKAGPSSSVAQRVQSSDALRILVTPAHHRRSRCRPPSRGGMLFNPSNRLLGIKFLIQEPRHIAQHLVSREHAA